MAAYSIVLFDVETDGLDYTKIHCIAVSPDGLPPLLFTDTDRFDEWAEMSTDESTMWVAHNACGFDFWVINELTKTTIPRKAIMDTSVLSKLKHYKKYQTHSLAEIGKSLGTTKGEYTGGWEEYSLDMGEYCKQDVWALQAIWGDLKSYAFADKNEECIDVELEMALINAEMQRNGFKFNRDKAQVLLDDVLSEMAVLEDSMADQWPSELVEDRRIMWREKPDGTPYATVTKAMAAAPKWKRDGDELLLYKYKDFNPASSKDRVDKLWEAGWEPYDKTKGYYTFERELRMSRWKR